MLHWHLRLLPSGAFDSYLLSGHQLSMVTPRAALKVDDVGDVSVIERAAKRGHRARISDATHIGALQAVQYGTDMRGSVRVVDGSIAFERRERARQAFA